MSDDRKDGLPPFVQNDDSAAFLANFAERKRRAYAAVLAYSGSGPATPIVLVPDPTVDVNALPDWAVLRSELSGRLDSIETAFRQIRPILEFAEASYRESRGHNNPPDPIDILPINTEDLEIGTIATDLARTELNAEHPRFDVIRLCTRFFKWMEEKVTLFLDEFLKESGKRTMQVVAATALFQQLHVDLHDVVTKVVHVFELLHRSFWTPPLYTKSKSTRKRSPWRLADCPRKVEMSPGVQS